MVTTFGAEGGDVLEPPLRRAAGSPIKEQTERLTPAGKERPMKAKEVRFASILLGLVMALCLMPGLAIAEDGGPQTAANKPLQAIQATHMPVFTSDTGKNLNA